MPDISPLTPEEQLLLVQALQTYLHAVSATPETREQEQARKAPFAELQHRLKVSLGMGFYDTAGSWLDGMLGHEREALIAKLLHVVFSALDDPAMTRAKLRTLIVETTKEMKWERVSRLRPGEGWL